LPESCDNARVVFYAQVFSRMLGDNDKTSSLLSCDAPCDVGAESLNNVETLRRGVWVSSQIGCIQMSVSDSLVTSVDFQAKYPHLSTCTASKCRKAGISDVTP
jgi:hypothetical protein